MCVKNIVDYWKKDVLDLLVLQVKGCSFLVMEVSKGQSNNIDMNNVYLI